MEERIPGEGCKEKGMEKKTDMEIWEKNRECLKGKYQKLYEYLQTDIAQEIDREDTVEFGISEMEDKKVVYAVKQAGEEEQIIQLDSLYDSEALMELWSSGQTEIGSYQMKYVFFGFGNGMYLREILKRSDDSAKILVYEPSAKLFSFVLKHFDVSEILADSRISVIVEDYYDRGFEDELYRVISFSDLERLVYQAYPNYDRIFPKETKTADGIIQVMYSSIRATQGVLGRYGRLYTANGLLNIGHFLEGRSIYDLYKTIEKDIPVIIVASGPSLDKNVGILNQAKGKCLLVGLDSSVKALLKNNIEPDLFISVDADKHIDHFSDERISKIPLICELSSSFRVLNKVKEIKFFINDMNPYINRFFSKRGIFFPAFTTGGSVANTACSIFSSMGFQTIIMVGQDLAYSDNKSHSSETLRGSWEFDIEKVDTISVEGYYGGKVKTSYEFLLYLKWFEEEIAKNKDIKFVNATEGGAMIHGAENLSLQDAINRYCIKDVDIKQKLYGTKEFLTEELKQEFSEYIYEIDPALRKFRQLAEKALRNYGKMKELAYLDKYRSKSWIKMFQEAKQIGDKYEQEDVMIYVKNMVQNETTQILEHIYEKETDTKEEIIATCEIAESHLRAIIAGIDEIFWSDWIRYGVAERLKI